MSDFDKPATTVLSVGNRAVAVEVRGFAVEVVAGPDAGKSAQAKGRSLEIGTHATSDLVLSDEHVSRRHLRIEVEGNDCVLHDLGSTNGTRVGGVRGSRRRRSRRAPSSSAAQSRLRFSFSAAPVRVPLAERDDFEGLLGRSVAMRELFALLDRVAPTDASVLIQGETGTGKERVARALHARSRRAGAALRRVRLRGGAAHVDRGGAVRAREGRLHRRHRAARRRVRARRRRHRLPRRDGRAGARAATEAVARARVERGASRRRVEADADRRRASSPRPIAISARASPKGSFAKISTTASPS